MVKKKISEIEMEKTKMNINKYANTREEEGNRGIFPSWHHSQGSP